MPEVHPHPVRRIDAFLRTPASPQAVQSHAPPPHPAPASPAHCRRAHAASAESIAPRSETPPPPETPARRSPAACPHAAAPASFATQLHTLRVAQPARTVLDVRLQMKQRVPILRITIARQRPQLRENPPSHRARAGSPPAFAPATRTTSSSPATYRRSSSASANSGFAGSKRSQSFGARVISDTCRPAVPQRLRHPPDRVLHRRQASPRKTAGPHPSTETTPAAIASDRRNRNAASPASCPSQPPAPTARSPTHRPAPPAPRPSRGPSPSASNARRTPASGSGTPTRRAAARDRSSQSALPSRWDPSYLPLS